jgi:hypothetical protein
VPVPAGESRLDRMIARLLTQRACLGFAAGRLRGVPGPVLEVGLGKGRTFSHLRGLFPDRTIWAFDRDVHAPEDSRPPAARIILGDFHDSLPGAAAAVGAPAALVHADIGTEKRRGDAALARFVGATLGPLLAPGGLMVGDRETDPPDCTRLDPPAVALPDGIAPWPYFVYRRD